MLFTPALGFKMYFMLQITVNCIVMPLGCFTATICCEVIISDLLLGLIMSILRKNDLQTDLDPAGIHQVLTKRCNRQLCHRLSSLLLMLFSLKWLPIIVFFLSCLPDVISPAKWQKKKKNHASGHLLDLTVRLLRGKMAGN